MSSLLPSDANRINESPRTSGSSLKSSLASPLHTLNALARYPNFLMRHTKEDIEVMESELMNYVQAFSAMKESTITKLLELEQHANAYRAPSPLPLEFDADGDLVASSLLPHLTPPAAAILAYLQAQYKSPKLFSSLPAALSHPIPIPNHLLLPFVDMDTDGLFIMDTFTPPFMDAVLSHVQSYRRYLAGRTSTSNVLRTLDIRHVPGFTWINDFLFQFISRPLTVLLFPKVPPLDWFQGYIISYNTSEAIPAEATSTRTSLPEHTDDSETTINLCLSPATAFDGGELVVGETRGVGGEEEECGFELKQGAVIMHAGRRVHSVSEVTGGERHVLIQWARSKAFRRENCPCCFLSGREGECICGPKWF